VPREAWTLKGELALSCNCTVFCPCVLSLGQHPPTEGYCQTWSGVRIEDGHYGDTDLSGINLGLVMEIPGLMARGNWTAGVFIDDRASVYAVNALTKIFSGRAGGSTSLLSILVGNFLGVRQAPIEYKIEDKTRIVRVEGYIDGAITPISGQDGGGDVLISNSQYWIAPDVTVCQSEKSRMRAFGRNWNFAGRSAELCRLDWAGP
jgi:hypothetical protein